MKKGNNNDAPMIFSNRETKQWNLPNGQRMLAEVFDHPSMPKGKNVSTLGIIDSTSDNWDVS